MSMQSMHEFLTAAVQRPDLAEGLALAVGEKRGEPAIAATAAYAQGQGYDVTVEDAWVAHQRVKRALEQGGELSDEDLAEVYGGLMGTPPDNPALESEEAAAFFQRVAEILRIPFWFGL